MTAVAPRTGHEAQEVASDHLVIVDSPPVLDIAAPPQRARLLARSSRLLPLVIPGGDLIALLLTALLLGAGPNVWVFATVAFISLAAIGSQQRRISPRLADDLAVLVGVLGAAFILAVALLPVTLPEARGLALVSIVAVPVFRLISYSLVRAVRQRGWVIERVLVVGSGSVGREVADMLSKHPEYGLDPIGFLDSFTEAGLALPVLGEAKQLAAAVRRWHVHRVIVAFGASRSHELIRVIRDCDTLPVEIHVVPRFYELGMSARTRFTDDLWGIPLVRLRRSALRPVARVTKRLIDLSISTVMLTLLAPVMVAVGVAIKISSPGPVFFQQHRIGQDGKVVMLLKFRTMKPNQESETRWGNGRNDDRTTKVGHFLRATSLDELPQLLNVARGDMSLVGPRPERPHFADLFAREVPRYDDRHRVPVGITGWAQVHGLRGDTDIGERARFDNEYIEHWSLYQDLVILGRTAAALVKHRGA